MGQKLVRRKGLTRAWALIAVAACAPQKNAIERLPEPQVPATVLTIETKLQPQNKTFQHSIIIVGGHARSEDEVDRWRLFDLDHDQVTFVDDGRRTYETQPVSRAIAERRDAAAGPLPAGVPRAQVISTGASRVINGVQASQLLIRLGGYQRELWIGNPRSVPPNLFPTWFATRPVDSKYEPMMRDADEALMNLRGFPLLDHAELPFGNSKLVVDRNVVKIEQRNVQQSLLTVNRAYRELTAPAVSPPPVSSPPRGRSTPATGSQSSATSRKNS